MLDWYLALPWWMQVGGACAVLWLYWQVVRVIANFCALSRLEDQ